MIEAKALSATSLAMGAHRHGTWLESLLGHTTHQALHHPEIPFLMAHRQLRSVTDRKDPSMGPKR